jgi:aspartyl-tRNA(Asn)/glutamyl-tRNA(Gln) amidotransferase subunit B
VAGITEEMRTKEHAHDYRYFPEPDLMPFEPTDAWLVEVKSRVVELPLARKQRFMRDYQLPATDADVFKSDVELGDYFERVAKRMKTHKAVANWVINNLRAKLSEANQSRAGAPPAPTHEEGGQANRPALHYMLSTLRFPPEALVDLIGLVENKTLSTSAAQQVFAEMFDTGKSPSAIVQERGLAQVSDAGAIERICDEVIAAHPGPASDFRAGKSAALNFLKGQVMKLSKGRANPAVAGEVLERKLKS